MVLVYDLHCQPVSIGDLLTHQAASLCFGEKVDVDLIETTGKPPEHAVFKWLFPVARVNPMLGQARICREVRKHDWPVIGGYTTYECWKLLNKHFEKHGFITHLKPLPETEAWAKDFLKKNGNVTVNYRRSNSGVGRNSDDREWASFFKHRPDQKFVVTCSPQELPNWSFSNVTFFTGDTEKMCALIGTSDVHLGVASGPVQMRWYQDKPFSVFREPIQVARVSGMYLDGASKKMPWMNDKQRMYEFPEKAERLLSEFDFLIG